jgi:hypothetical protein
MVLVPMEQDALKTSNSGLLRGLLVGQISGIIRGMERVVHKAKGFKEAEEWDIEQQVSMTPEQRLRAAKELCDRFYPANAKDVRACHDKR